MHAVPLVAAMLAYAVAVGTSLFGRTLPRRSAVVVGGVVLHVLGFVLLWIESRAIPVVSLTEGLTAVSLLVAVVAAAFLRRAKMELATDSLLALSTLLLLGASSTHGVHPVELGPPTWFLAIHVSLIFLGLAGFSVSFCLSVLFLLLRRRLKRHDLKGIRKLPALDTIDVLNFRAMVFGFVTLTAGSIMGGLYAWRYGLASVDLTIWATGLVWLWYAVALQGRVIGGWRGRFAALFGVLGFAGVTILLAALGVIFRGWHGLV